VSDVLKDTTVEFIFEHTKEAPERQSRDMQTHWMPRWCRFSALPVL
jgi:hypothetical protein